MSVEQALWRIDSELAPIQFEAMGSEARLEELLARNIEVAAPHLMVIGRQVTTPHGGRVDLLAMNSAGGLAVIELKRDKTPRDIVAQVLDYAGWVRGLRDEDIGPIYTDFLKRWHPEQKHSINEAFCKRFRVKSIPDELNADHELIIVASSLDPASERIVTYLADTYGVKINVVFFRFFRDGDREYLSRVWLMDPNMPVDAAEPAQTGEWNGEYYVCFGGNDLRDWEEARKYGFISSGGGTWYTNTLQMLEKGSRVWVNVPGTGYVGVGIVEGPRVPVDEFMVKNPAGQEVPITTLPLKMARMTTAASDPELAEYLVPVKWLKTVPVAEAIKEVGFFGNQNTVARPTAPKWAHTVARLKERFGVA